MRIAGYIDHPTLKISILHMNHRYAVKFEKMGMEQVYKIRESESVKNADDVKKLVSTDIIESVESSFNTMNAIRIKMLIPSIIDSDNFEEII